MKNKNSKGYILLISNKAAKIIKTLIEKENADFNDDIHWLLYASENIDSKIVEFKDAAERLGDRYFISSVIITKNDPIEVYIKKLKEVDLNQYLDFLNECKSHKISL